MVQPEKEGNCMQGKICKKKNTVKVREGNIKGGGDKGKNGESKGKRKLLGRRQTSINITSCAIKLVLFARLNEKKASALSKQVKRIMVNDKIQGSKAGKKGEFNRSV